MGTKSENSDSESKKELNSMKNIRIWPGLKLDLSLMDLEQYTISFRKISQCLGSKKWEQKLFTDAHMHGRTFDHDISPHGPLAQVS